MSVYTAAYADIRINDDTRFRTQGQFISDSMQSAGWTKVTDASQIDWSSVSAPVAANTSQGYEIRGSGEGIYIKIEYGSGTNTYSKGFWLTIGTGQDGAGAITEVLFPRTQLTTYSAYSGGSAKPGDDFISGTAMRLSVAVTDDANAYYGGGFVLQKTHNAAQTEDAYGWWLITAVYSQTANLYGIGPRSLSTAAASLASVKMPKSVGDGSNIPTLPIFAVHPLYGFIAVRDLYATFTSLVTHQTTVTIDGKTYLSFYGNTTSNNVWAYTAVAAQSLLMRYD